MPSQSQPPRRRRARVSRRPLPPPSPEAIALAAEYAAKMDRGEFDHDKLAREIREASHEAPEENDV